MYYLPKTRPTQLARKGTNLIGVPNNQHSIHPTCTDLRHLAPNELIRPHFCDRILMHSGQLRIARSAPCPRLAPDIRVPKSRERRRVQTARGSTAPKSAARGRGLGVVEGASHLPTLLRAREDEGATVVARGDDGVLGGPGEGDEW